MLIVLPANGQGVRFREAGYHESKPFLKVGDKSLVEIVVEHLPPAAGVVFAAWHEDVPRLRTCVPKAMIIRIHRRTRGPVETLLEPSIRDVLASTPGDILLADCDSFFSKPQEVAQAIEIFRADNADGGVTVRPATERWASYARVEDGWVLETREKDPFTGWSTTGPYWWRRGQDFLDCAGEALKAGNYDNSPLYNWLIHKGGRVRAVEVTSFQHLGTPEAYEAYLRSTHI